MLSFINILNDEEKALFDQTLETIFFPKDTRIIEQGTEGNGCYIIEDGRVRIEYDPGETDTDAVLNYLEPGMILGEFSLLDKEPRSANVYAHTDVKARWFSTSTFEHICQEHQSIAIKLLSYFSKHLIGIVRQTNKQIAEYILSSTGSEMVDHMVSNAVTAQKLFESFSDEKTDAILNDIAKTISENAEILAQECVKETGLGVVEHKIQKILFSSQTICKMLIRQKSFGILDVNNEKKLTTLASPMGVVLGIIPLTNPVSTIVFKTLICIKSRNALIFSCHRDALNVANKTGELIRDVLIKHQVPQDLIQWIRERSSRKITHNLMSHKDVAFILATGGPSIVKAAYSSGTPAIGVGAGNAPVLICSDVNTDKVAQMIVNSKSFDNGVICGSENNLVVESAIQNELIGSLIRHGAAVLESSEINIFTNGVFDAKTHKLRKEVIGKSAASILDKLGIHREYGVKLIVIPLDKELAKGQYGREKLSPILPLFTVKDAAEGLKLSKEILHIEGQGHTAIIHTNNQKLINDFGMLMPASRILVNCPGSQGCIGLANGLVPSLTLGCGTLGKTSTTDNVSYTNLLNIKRLAHAL